jgi:hypothetical protein
VIASLTGILCTAGIPLLLLFPYSWWLKVVLVSVAGVLAVGGVGVSIRIARDEGVRLTRAVTMAAFVLAYVLTFASLPFTPAKPVPGTLRCSDHFCNQTYAPRAEPAAVVLLVLAALVLVVVPSNERELSRRIDLEACGVAVPLSFFFFLSYEAFQRGFDLPHFSAGIALGTLLTTYLLARLALTIRYR